MRIALGGISHEANTFSPEPGRWEDFRTRKLRYGPDALADVGQTRIEEAGMLSVLADEPDCEVVPLLLAKALSGAPVVGEVFRALRDDLVARLKAALPVDGVLLVLHGAMMAEGEPDATGAVLQAVRQVVGPDVPVVGTLDLHANVTARMVREATALIGYHTAPHIDMYEAGETAASVILGTIHGEIRPTMALVRLPMLVPAENSRHTDGPLSRVIGQALALEEQGAILHGGIYPVQPWMDTPDIACAVLVITDGDAQAAQNHARALARTFWGERQAFVPTLTPPDEALRGAYAREKGLVVFCDSADAPSSGATGDSTTLLQAVLGVLSAQPQTVAPTLLNVVDAPAVAQAIAAGVGQPVTVSVGGTLAPAFFQPLTFTGRVRLIGDGEFAHKGLGMRGDVQRMGRVVVLVQGPLHLVVMERPVIQWDPQLYRSLGEEPTDYRVVQVKSPAAFRAAYGPLADEIVIIAAPGVASPHLTALPWHQVRRPLYPLDEDTVWEG